jgi:hypothetical protein
MNGKTTFILCAVLFAVAAPAQQFVEITAELELTTWSYQEETGFPLKKTRVWPTRCVVGTNAWLIQKLSNTNFTEDIWFMDGKIIRQTTVTRDSDSDEPGYFTSRRGSRSANVAVAPDGYPASDLFVNVPWFAFCSGPYLKRPGRAVPLPAPLDNRGAFGFTDETTVFNDSLGLPRRVGFHTVQRQLKAEYQVQNSTNVLGWNFPLAFTVVQNEPDKLGKWNRQLSVSGRVTSIRPARKPELPEDLRERLEYWEQTPTRRR